jgi:DNA-binding MarR family transcriptional regulator
VNKPADLPLSTLLSHALVAFTIELDNAFEQRMPHKTATGAAKGGRGPWLTSYAMYANFLRLVDDTGTPLPELRDAARITNLNGLIRWRYVTVAEGIVRPTAWGVQARAIWRPLAAEIEARWVARLGASEIVALCAALRAVLERFPRSLPAYLPVLRADMRSLPTRAGTAPAPDDLSSLLAGVLLAFTLDFEQESPLSLPLCANILRVLGATAVNMRDMPARSGVSKEAIGMALGILDRRGLVVIEPNPDRRGQGARLTDQGAAARRDFGALLAEIESRWRQRMSDADIEALRAVLARIAPRLTEGTTPPPTGWRAGLKRPLPHHPMVLHRGGYPDGA